MRGSAWVLAITLTAVVITTLAQAKPPGIATPEGVRLTPLSTISPLKAKILLRLAGVEGLPVRYSVDTYRMEYSSRGKNGEPVQLSGLLALPHGVAARRLVSFQHGTSTTRTAVPSKPDGTGLASAIIFAGNGYALIAPDYPGLGVSTGRHPYYVAASIGPAVVDMIEVTERLGVVPDVPVFLAGFSEGGWASLQALRLLEARGDKVMGVASVAGPINLSGISFPAAMKGRAKSHSLYLAYAAWGQAAYYGHSLDSVLTANYAATVERLFASGKPKAIIDGLPTDPRAMFNDAFLSAYDNGKYHWFIQAFSGANLVDLNPRAPLRLFYGSADVDVSPQDSITAAAAMRAKGADVLSVDVGPVEHNPSMLAAAPMILAWMQELEATKSR